MKKLGRPKSTAEKKVVVSGYVSASRFREIAKLAIKSGSISKVINDLIEKGLETSHKKEIANEI